MTKEQVTKHGEVITWWAKNPEQGVWVYFNSGKGWVITHNPNFDVGSKFVQDDKYHLLRKELALGKTIQYYVDGFVGWQDVTSFKQACPELESFRVKPKPEIKVGYWVTFFDITTDRPRMVIKVENGVAFCNSNKCLISQCEIWEPKEGEWCVFWDTNEENFNIRKFKSKANSLYFVSGSCNQTPYNSVAPLEYINVIKEL